MKPRTKYILLALLINLAMLLQAPNSPMRAIVTQPGAAFFPCCQTTETGRRYCCQNCCFDRWDCRDDRQCKIGQQ